MTFRFGFVSVVIAFGSLFATSAPAPAQYGATDGEWRSYGGDNGSTKYSPLDQIDAGNFSSLEIAWRAPTPDARLDFDAIAREQERRGRVGEAPPGGNADYGLSLRLFKATPLMVDGLLFVSTPLSQAAAFDAGTGDPRWVHDPESYFDGPPASRANSRGAAYWSDGDVARVYWGTTNGYLIGASVIKCCYAATGMYMTAAAALLRRSANIRTSLSHEIRRRRDTKMSRRVSRRVARPACIAGVRISRPNFSAPCGRMKL